MLVRAGNIEKWRNVLYGKKGVSSRMISQKP